MVYTSAYEVTVVTLAANGIAASMRRSQAANHHCFAQTFLNHAKYFKFFNTPTIEFYY